MGKKAALCFVAHYYIHKISGECYGQEKTTGCCGHTVKLRAIKFIKGAGDKK